MRKPLGLLSLLAMLMHLLLSTFLWQPSYYASERARGCVLHHPSSQAHRLAPC
jgi:hypothetical protein